MEGLSPVVAAQQAGEERLIYCEALLSEDPPFPEEIVVSEPIGPYCGCPTCIVREVLAAAWPHLLVLARDEAAGRN